LKPFDFDGDFVRPGAVEGVTIRRLTVRGAGATVVAGGLTLAIQVGATMVLARLLVPADFGLVAMVTTFSLLLVNFGFNGLTEAIVQREQINHRLASTLFWINVGCGVLLTLLFAATGSLLARFYHDPPVQRIALLISLTIVLTSLSTVHLALLKRAMHFSSVSVNDIAARLTSVVISIVLGFLGWGYWALVAGAIALPVSTCVGAWLICRWIPGLPRKGPGTLQSLSFAFHTYGNFATNYLSRNTDNLLVGWRFNAQALGYYKKAYDLFALSANQLVGSIAVVVLAALSRVKKDAVLFRSYLIDAMAAMTFLGMGLGAGLTLCGKDLILLLLGAKWAPAGHIFTFFGPGIGIMILYATHGWIHLSVGRPERWFRWAILEFIVTCLLFILGLHWGPVGVATAWSVSFWILTIPAIWYAGEPIGLKVSSVLSAIWRYFAASMIAIAGTVLALHALPSFERTGGTVGALLRVVEVGVLVTPLYLGAVVLLHGSFAPLLRMGKLVREMVRLRSDATLSAQQDESVAAAGARVATTQALPPVALVSILIPAYNAQRWIADTLRSALEQTWPRIEIIVVDDGSKDETVTIARQFESQGVCVVVQSNQGASAARNNAFAHSHGDFIQWLDADDLLAPDKIAKQMEPVMQGLVGPRTLLSGSWAHFMYRPWRAEFKPSSLWCDLSPREWLIRKMGENIFMQTGTWLVSREMTEAAGPWDTRLLGDDDGEYFCRVLMASEGVRFIADAKVYYRAFRFDGLSYIGRFPEKIDAHWKSMQLHIRYLRSYGDDARARAACVQYIRDSLIYFYPESPQIMRQVSELTQELGEPVGAPGLSWKYAWIEKSMGWNVTKAVQRTLRRIRWRFEKWMEYALFRLEKQGSLPHFQSDDRSREVADQKSILEASRIKSSGEIAS
jgi:O-antigen/teichoic acid export membrane protein/glycosyltransferase involved in cell wall biosynthesis